MNRASLAGAVAERDWRSGPRGRRGVLVVVAAVVCAALLTGAGLGPAAGTARAAGASVALSGGRWGKAEAVPGLAALNKGGNAEVVSVSCWSAGNCAAGGYYDGRFPDFTAPQALAFVVDQKNGRWGKAVQVPGTAALNKGGYAEVSSVSCTRRGTCVAAGFYTDAGAHQQGFVASLRGGRWGAAVQLPGLAALNTGGDAQVDSVSCSSPGNCAAGGSYSDAGGTQGFVASQRNGRWRPAVTVGGLAALNTGGTAQVDSVSCASAGNCAGGGSYQTTPSPSYGNQAQAFVVSEQNGRWGSAEQVPGLTAMNTSDWARVTAVSCVPGGNCGAGGYYLPVEESALFGFVVSEKNGRWGTAAPVAYHGYLIGDLDAVSCPSAGNCAAAGSSTGDGGPDGAWVVNEKKGSWGPVDDLSRPVGQGSSTSMSCWSAGNCVAGGSYTVPSEGDNPQAFIVSEKSGRWGDTKQVSGLVALSKGGGDQILSLSCLSAGGCSAGGSYGYPTQGFVVSQAK
jgi:hypothetical protein